MEKKWGEIYNYLSSESYPEGYDKSQRQNLWRRVVKTREEAKNLFEEFHSSPIGAHTGIIKTRNARSSRFYWFGMSVDIENWIFECDKWQKVGKPLAADQKLECIQPTPLRCNRRMAQHALLTLGSKAWRCFSCPKSELRLDLTLGCGQTFRWRETGEGHWTGVMGGRVWTLTQTDDTLWYHVYRHREDLRLVDGRKRKKAETSQESGKKFKEMAEVKVEENEQSLCTSTSEQDAKDEEVLRDYFQLSVKLEDLYKEWGDADPHFSHTGNIFSGVRMLRQDPVECLFSFICSSNNHITRIQGMVERLCGALGTPLCQLEGTHYHDFPSVEALADSSVEAQLRDLGFGYRARFLQESAHLIMSSHGPKWLHSLRKVPYPEARAALLTLPGVGPKVADCVCLMSLDKSEAVPVDTHVWQIARRDYSCAAGSKQKTLTDKVYKEIGDFFRKLWGSYSGWAHSVLFCADLKKFQKLKEMPTIKEEKSQASREEKRKNTNCQRRGNVVKKKEGD